MSEQVKDWTGNRNSIFKTLGASNHTDKERQSEDFYATSPEAAEWLLKLENLDKNIWEPCAGEGDLSKVFDAEGYNVYSTDLIDRGYGIGGIDFLSANISGFDGDIVTNPPYSFAQEVIEKALSIIPIGNKVCMFLKVQFLEGKKRKQLFKDNPPIRVWISSSRIMCAKNGDFEGMKKGGGSAVAYAWYVWEKGFKGKTTIDWFN